MRIPLPVTDSDDPATLRRRWNFWLTLPQATADELRKRESLLHQAFINSQQEKLRHSWIYGDE